MEFSFVSNDSNTSKDSVNFSFECSIGDPNLAISQAKAPRATPRINLPSVRISAVATSPA